MAPKKLFFLFLIVFSTLSFVLLLVTTTNISDSARRSAIASFSAGGRSRSRLDDQLTPKELELLRKVVVKRGLSSNLLFFGANRQYVELASRWNQAGTTVFLEDDVDRIESRFRHSAKFYWVGYRSKASDAYRLLKHAREHPACWPASAERRGLKNSRCPLALRGLPADVLDADWDVIVIDGPSGAAPEFPGRMGAIYTSAAIAAAAAARTNSTVDVFVHDVDRTIERWYAWEFLCDENLVASKGKLWQFQIHGRRRLRFTSRSSFCSSDPIHID